MMPITRPPQRARMTDALVFLRKKLKLERLEVFAKRGAEVAV